MAHITTCSKLRDTITFMFLPCILNNKCLLYYTNILFCNTHTPNQALHMRPHSPKFYHNNTLLYCILSF